MLVPDGRVWDQAGQGYGWFQMFHGWSAFALEIATLQSMLHAATEMELELQLHAARLPLGPFWSPVFSSHSYLPLPYSKLLPYGLRTVPDHHLTYPVLEPWILGHCT